ncbi:MAG: DNA replication and repair protein RecF [Deltaproteobacteria bacterium]|nr:DNA replication and repair protein RecF [Deltaproteobacteria bacterium]
MQQIQNIQISHFRNISSQEILFHPKFNFFFGQNAQGKTSVLEALYFLSELKSFRSSDFTHSIQHSNDQFLLESILKQEDLRFEIKVKASFQEKQVWLNGKTPRPYRKLRRLLPYVLFLPESIRLFRNSPSERRNYFDDHFSLLSEEYSHLVQEYARIYKQKHQLLIQQAEGSYTPKNIWEIWNEQIARQGAKLTYSRFQWGQSLGKMFQFYFSDLSDQEWKATLHYEPYQSLISEEKSEEEIYDLYNAEIQKRFSEELTRQQVLVGPHRDDWMIHLGSEKLKEDGSQGQHRIAVAALKLAEMEHLRTHQLFPIALFDDLLSELDTHRNRKVMECLAHSPCQVFLTSVEPHGFSWKDLEGSRFELQEGQVFLKKE